MRSPFVQIERITHNPAVMGGKPCIRGLRVTVGTVLGLLAGGKSRERILEAYPYLEPEDIDAAIAYAAWTRRAGRAARRRMSVKLVIDMKPVAGMGCRTRPSCPKTSGCTSSRRCVSTTLP